MKSWPEYFELLAEGKKPFEIRRNDRDFHAGDTLLLREWDPETEQYSGREIEAEVILVLGQDDFTPIMYWWNPEYVVMSILVKEQHVEVPEEDAIPENFLSEPDEDLDE